MAVTWDLELDHVGVGVDRTEGILVSAFGLTTLTQSTDYRIRVRAVDTTNGVIVYSPWTAWLDFTTQAAATDITVNLDLITNTQSIHAVTATVPPVVAITDTYDLRVTEVGVGSNVITAISESNYTLTGLTGGSDYELEVRLVRSVDGVIYYSAWSNPVAFTAGAAQPDPITVNIGTLVNTQTIYSMTATIADPISADIGLITNTQTIHSITGIVSDPVGPVIADIGLVTNTQTLHAMTVTVPELGDVVPATHWIVTLIDLSDMSIVSETLTFSSDFSFTGLTANKNYRISVVGISQIGSISSPVNLDFNTVPQTITYYSSITVSSEQGLDQFYVSIDPSVLSGGDNVRDFFGTVSDGDLQGDIMITFEGQTLPAKRLLTEWSISMIDGARLGISDTDELNRKFGLLLSGDMQSSGDDGFLITGT